MNLTLNPGATNSATRRAVGSVTLNFNRNISTPNGTANFDTNTLTEPSPRFVRPMVAPY